MFQDLYLKGECKGVLTNFDNWLNQTYDIVIGMKNYKIKVIETIKDVVLELNDQMECGISKK